MKNKGQADSPDTQAIDVLIIGAGASGLMCARAAARRGRSVLLLDHGTKAARKVLVSGGGRCNITNLNADASHYIGNNPDFTRSALARFTPRDILELLDKHHIPHEEREDGRMFLTVSATRIVEALIRDCRNADISTVFGAQVRSFHRKDNGFEVCTTKGTYICASLVIATGGKSWSSLGSSAFGYQIARQFGHEVTELRPGLVPLVLKGRTVFTGLNGISFRATLTAGGRSFTDDVLVTHRGLSGPAVLQVSSFWSEGKTLAMDLLPGEDALEWLMAHAGERRELKNLLATRLPRRLAHRIAEHSGGSAPINSLSERQLKHIAQTLGSLELKPSGTEGFAQAEVTVGGVDTRRISSKSMESLIAPGLFFIGEVLDVTGELGGFNLHWAWVSAMAAGEHV